MGEELVEVPEKEGGFNPSGLDDALDKIKTDTPEPDKPALEVVKPDIEKQPVTGDDDTLSWVKGLDAQTLKDMREGHMIPKHRLDEVSQRMKLYESFGSPEELIAKFKAQTPPAKAEVAPSEPLTDEDKAFQAYFLKMFPQFKDVPRTVEDFGKFQAEFQKSREIEHQNRVADRNALIKSGESKIEALAKEAGLDIDPRNLALHVGAVTDLLHSDENKALAEKFYNSRDVEVLKTVFDDYFNRLFSGFQRKAKADLLQDKDRQAKLQKPPIKVGAAPVEPAAKKAKTFDEAGDAGWEMLKAAQ